MGTKSLFWLASLLLATSAAAASAQEIRPIVGDGPMAPVPTPFVDQNALEGCGNADCCPADCWSVYGKFLYMHRQNPGSTTLLVDNATQTQTLLNSSDFHFDFSPGADVGIIHQIAPGCDLEIRYMGIYNQSASQNPLLNTDATLVGVPFSFYRAPVQVNSTYEAELHSVEVNVGWEINPCWRLLAGFRWIHLAENLNSSLLEVNAVRTDISSSTTNNLYGFQLGIDGTLWQSCSGHSQLVGWGKAGVYCVEAEANSSVHDTRGLALSGNGSDSNGAFVGELGLEFRHTLCRHWQATIGGQLLWIQDVATAGDSDQQPLQLQPRHRDLHRHPRSRPRRALLRFYGRSHGEMVKERKSGRWRVVRGQ